MDSAHWQARLDDLARRYDVPGAALGVLRLGPDEARLELATGVLHRGTGVAATPDSVFQVGSITKVWTTTLLMTLVEEGLLDLDAPVATLLPSFRVADPGASARIMVRHLLSHASGFDGDMFVDTGRGDDCVAAFVGELGGSRQLFAPGTAWSYNNAGFVVAGRVAEVLTGGSWDAALRERVVAPLGVSRTVTLPEEVLLHRAAVGHLEDADGHPEPAPVWSLPRSCGPAGLVCSTVGDQLDFAAAHLRGGLLPDGSRLLAADSAAAMASEQAARVDVTGHDDASTWGLGWARGAWGGSRVLGHDGNTIGQSAYLRLLPEHGVSTVLLTNGGTADGLHRELVGELLRELVGVTVSPAVTPGTEPGVLPERAVGSWAQASARLDVRREGDGLVLRHTDTTPFAELDPDPVWERPLTGYDDGVLLVQRPHAQTWTPLTLETTADGVDLLHLGWRAHTRV